MRFRKHIFPAIAVALMLIVGLAAAPADAQAGRPRVAAAVGVVDCTPNGISWGPWKYIGPNDSAAGKICGNPGVGQSAVRTGDFASDGQCVSIFFQINQGATVYYGGVTSCGIGVITAGWTPAYPVYEVFVAKHPTGQNTWSAVTGWRYLCWSTQNCA
jgi:hypothetical protein